MASFIKQTQLKEGVAVPMIIFPKGVIDKVENLKLQKLVSYFAGNFVNKAVYSRILFRKLILTFIRTLYEIENGYTDRFHAL